MFSFDQLILKLLWVSFFYCTITLSANISTATTTLSLAFSLSLQSIFQKSTEKKFYNTRILYFSAQLVAELIKSTRQLSIKVYNRSIKCQLSIITVILLLFFATAITSTPTYCMYVCIPVCNCRNWYNSTNYTFFIASFSAISCATILWTVFSFLLQIIQYFSPFVSYSVRVLHIFRRF